MWPTEGERRSAATSDQSTEGERRSVATREQRSVATRERRSVATAAVWPTDGERRSVATRERRSMATAVRPTVVVAGGRWRRIGQWPEGRMAAPADSVAAACWRAPLELAEGRLGSLRRRRRPDNESELQSCCRPAS